MHIISNKFKKSVVLLLLVIAASFLLPPRTLLACGGKDVILSDDPALLNSAALISPERAREIAETFVTNKIPGHPLPLLFRKLEWVHGKLIYQFQSQPIDNYDGGYHLGPVNFKVESLVLDVDAKTGNIHLAAGCGSAPGKLLYTYNPSDFLYTGTAQADPLIANNTNFIARNTGNTITIDGKITPEEWKNTGHRYFYLGTYKQHVPSVAHAEPYYYAEVWAQVDEENIYFGVKTDIPYWLGLMFKGDPNLGMLGSYKDAKVMKSDGEISDRYFTQRPDKTFFLKHDDKNNIVSAGHSQNDYYSYEFAFPLKSYDAHDVNFDIGKAYNMLLVVGNTAEHHGIFTLDKAHANHDHSKNNEEHVDVWASNETTFRIGRAADRDIFGYPVTAAFTSFDSGYDPKKKDNHFHYLGTSLKEFTGRTSFASTVNLITIVVGLIGLGIIIMRFRSPANARPVKIQESEGFDLMGIKPIRRFVNWRFFRHIFIIPTLIVFLLIIYLGFFDTQDGQRNIATVFTWTLWWSLIIFTFIVAGRLWCMMCPFAFLGDLVQKVVSLNRKLPKWLQNMGFQTFGFIVLTWAFTALAFGSKPLVTALVIVFILVATIVVSMIYQRRSFCRHVCPIGAVIGIYSMVSPVELRPCKEGRCDVHKHKTCTDACPMLESPHSMDNNVYCNFCMKCQPACTSRNLGLRLRSFGKDIYASLNKSSAEAFAALFLLGVVIVETLAMTSSWKPIEDSTMALLGINSQPIIYSTIFTLIIALPVAVFCLACYLLRLWMGRKEYNTKGLVTEFAFLFIPLGIALHFAHNVQHLLLESPIAVPATLRFLQNIGVGKSFSINWNPLPIIGLEPIFFLQMSILVAGFGFTLLVLYRLLKRFKKPLTHIYKMAVVMSLYALVVVLTSIYMLGLPMGGRHIH
jgi:hypothetical protein